MTWIISPGIVLAAVALSIQGPAYGSEASRAPFLALSEGLTTCGEFIAQPGTMQAARMEWVLGYISGRNRDAASPRERLIGSSVQKTDTIIAWLENYCRSHSLEPLLTAADSLYAELKRREGR